MNKKIASTIEEIADVLSHTDKRFHLQSGCTLPSTEALNKMMELLKKVIFPCFFGNSIENSHMLKPHLSIDIEKVISILSTQIDRALAFSSYTHGDGGDISLEFIKKIPSVKRSLFTDIEAMFNGDPAARSLGEVLFCYPSIIAMIHYRVAHELVKLNVPLIPRIITEMAHSKTGIDIHPAAQIADYFVIDHGTGVVIGETCIIGQGVKIYQGVTLGARSFSLDDDGNPMSTPRHPIIKDGVTIYSNSSILGRITIGEGSIIGGNTWVTNDVAPNTKISQHSLKQNHEK